MNDMLSVTDTLDGKTVLLTGVTGLVGRMVLHQLLRHVPSLTKVLCLIRPGEGGADAAERLHGEVLGSRYMLNLVDELARTERPIEARTGVIPGDLAAERLGCDERAWNDLVENVDVIVNCGGLVEFTGPLDTALEANVHGPARLVGLAEAATRRGRRVAVCHMSTSFVSGPRNGRIVEALPSFVRSSEVGPLILDEERAQRILGELRDAVEDVRCRAKVTEGDRETRKARKRAMIVEGRRHARRLGWPNVYTLTKAIGEHLLWSNRGKVPISIVRPSVVVAPLHESRGWLEGRDSVTPIAALMWHGQRWFPIARGHRLDTIPVDLVANATIAIAASTMTGAASGVYHLCSSEHSAPLEDVFAYTWQGLKAAAEREPASRLSGRPVAVPDWLFRSVLSPGIQFTTTGAGRSARQVEAFLDYLVRHGAPGSLFAKPRSLVRRARAGAGQLQTAGLILDAYAPFFARYRPVFDARRVRSLYENIADEDAARLPFDPENTDWPDYWRDSVMAGVLRFGFSRIGLRQQPAPAARTHEAP